MCLACLVSTHILATHSAAGHLEVVLPVVLRVKWVLGAGMEQCPYRLFILEHQVNIAYRHTEKFRIRSQLYGLFGRGDSQNPVWFRS